MKSWICAALFMATATVCASEPATPFRVDKILAVMRNPQPDLVLLTAHRGLWLDVPENTIAAMDAAVEAGLETVEIDVRLSGDGTPWLVHDYSLERLTTGSGFLSAYRDASLLQSVRLKDRHGKPTTQRPAQLTEALDYLASKLQRDAEGFVRGFVLIIDLKSPAAPTKDPNAAKASGYEALKKSWQVLKAHPASNLVAQAVVFKLKGKELPESPATLRSDLGIDVPGSPPFYLQPVLHPDETASPTILKNYWDETFIIGFEVVLEYLGQTPAQSWVDKIKTANRTLPGFPGWNDYPEGVALSSAICCLDRNTDPARGVPDYSGSFEFHLQAGATWLTADTALTLNTVLKARGLRNLDRLR